jgi:hypothetical protein
MPLLPELENGLGGARGYKHGGPSGPWECGQRSKQSQRVATARFRGQPYAVRGGGVYPVDPIFLTIAAVFHPN